MSLMVRRFLGDRSGPARLTRSAGEVLALPAAATAISEQALAHGSVQRLRLPEGGHLRCMAGSLWITCDGDVVELVIEAGTTLEVPRRSGWVAYALEDAVLRVFPAPAGRQAFTCAAGVA